MVPPGQVKPTATKILTHRNFQQTQERVHSDPLFSCAERVRSHLRCVPSFLKKKSTCELEGRAQLFRVWYLLQGSEVWVSLWTDHKNFGVRARGWDGKKSGGIAGIVLKREHANKAVSNFIIHRSPKLKQERKKNYLWLLNTYYVPGILAQNIWYTLL